MTTKSFKPRSFETHEAAKSVNPPLIVILLCPERSAFNASFPLAQGLVDRGYEVLYLGTPDFESYVKAQGFGYASFSYAPSPDSQFEQSGWFATLKRHRRDFLHWEQEQEKILAHAEDLLRARPPVLLLVDPLVTWRSLLAYRCGIPSVGVNATMASTFTIRIPPAFSPLLPGKPKSLLAIWRNSAAWGRCIWKAWWPRFKGEKLLPLRLGLAPRRSAVSRVKKFGARVLWGEYGPWLDLPELVLTIRELDFPVSAQVRDRTYVGSCMQLARVEGQFDWSGFDNARPLVYCSLGTYSGAYPNARQFFSSVVEILKRREDLQGIVQVGDAMAVEAFGSLPDRIKVLKFVPQLEVLRRAQVFVTHGGPSSLREAFYFGVPVIVFPCWFDQIGNAARVMYHGLGLRGDIATASEKELGRLLDEVLQGRFQENVVRMQGHFREQLPCRDGVDFVESFLRDRQACGSASVRPPHLASV